MEIKTSEQIKTNTYWKECLEIANNADTNFFYSVYESKDDTSIIFNSSNLIEAIEMAKKYPNGSIYAEIAFSCVEKLNGNLAHSYSGFHLSENSFDDEKIVEQDLITRIALNIFHKKYPSEL